jgi:hypothetical protein
MLKRVLALGSLPLLFGCSEQQVVAELRSLSGSEDAVFLCRDADGVGHPYSDCPDRDSSNDDEPSQHLSVMALVSQTLTDEVAVVNVTDGHVIDVDPSTPGYGFLRVGGRPVAMAATPGGSVTFVATADVGRNGLFALPTKKLGAPVNAMDENRDLTSWSACRLDDTPGEVALVAGTGCAGADGAGAETDLSRLEGGALQKLVVSFPDLGLLRVYDAQTILNLPPGEFPRCEAQSEVVLAADVPAGVTQTLPADLVTSCSDVPVPMAPPPSKRAPQPAGFAASDNRLYIADRAAPVIHVLDTTNGCQLTELPSLLPMSLREPERVVTTRKVAVSPLTPAGQQFVYAIDSEDQPAASVMVFDVSPGSTDPTPLVRPGSPELPNEKPDRLALSGAAARDVTFAYRDIPYVDPDTGAAQFGVRCDPVPDPSGELMQSLQSTLARPNADFTSGARPGLLRGLFAFVLLTSGAIVTVDVDDLDADCRRPVSANQSTTPDFRGCAGDPIDNANGGYTLNQANGPLTVTNEVSCRVVQPHRVRSSRLALNNSQVGIRAPSLSGFPQLSGAGTSVVEDRPRLLAAPWVFQADSMTSVTSTQLYVGSTLYSYPPGSGDDLLVDPNARGTDQLELLNSLVLPPLEPRSYRPEDSVSLTYEGSLFGGRDRTAGFLTDEGRFTDQSLPFCSAGVYDPTTMADFAARELGLGQADAEAFGTKHGDYVQIVANFPDASDSYWSRESLSRDECVAEFGEVDATTLLPSRELRITEAFSDHLQLEPRFAEVTFDRIRQCFPTSLRYRIRGAEQWILLHDDGATFRHDVVASGADGRCVRSCDPLRKWAKGRAFEVSSRNNCREPIAPGDEVTDADRAQRVGCAADDEVACTYSQPLDNAMQPIGLVQPGGEASECIFNSLNERFVIYRGSAPSVRDMVFNWRVTGGFSSLVMSLAGLSSTVSPQSIQFLPQPEQLAVVDGASQGLSLWSLDTFGVVKPSPFY